MWEFLREIAPVRSEIEVGAAVSAVGTFFCYFAGGYDALLEALLVVIVLDYLTGLTAACFERDKRKGPSSKRGLQGFCKKMFMLSLVALAHQIDAITGGGSMVRTITIWFFFGNEGLSIIENAARIGLPVPVALKNKLAQLAQEKYTKNVEGNRK